LQVCVGVQQLLRIGCNIPPYFIKVVLDAITHALPTSTISAPDVNIVNVENIRHTTVRVFRTLGVADRSIELVRDIMYFHKI
jgi:hypothetical protein